jgi:16S rRNA (cytidine1402-2'-O)-methyltransferase
LAGTLYLVGTPIGNLGDLSPRAAEILGSVDFVAAEDTRVTLKLMNHLGLRKPLVSYYEHNRASSGERILSRLLAGESCALVTDAGMPAISDPGEDLVHLCRQNGVVVSPVPGPSALTAALAASGIRTGRFCFEGFLSRGTKSRREHLEKLRAEERTMVFYEAPHKLLYTLRDLYECLGDRRAAICRELTKIHEEILHTTLSGAIEHFTQIPPRGEFVIVVEGAGGQPAEADDEEAVEYALGLVEEGMSVKDAAKKASERFRISRNSLYSEILKRARED